MINRIKEIIGTFAQDNKSKLARDLGMNTRTVTQYVEGESKLSVDFIVNILKAYPSISAEWLMRGKGDMCISQKDDTVTTQPNYAHICEQMADMYAEISKLRAKIAVLEAKKGEAVA